MTSFFDARKSWSNQGKGHRLSKIKEKMQRGLKGSGTNAFKDLCDLASGLLSGCISYYPLTSCIFHSCWTTSDSQFIMVSLRVCCSCWLTICQLSLRWTASVHPSRFSFCQLLQKACLVPICSLSYWRHQEHVLCSVSLWLIWQVYPWDYPYERQLLIWLCLPSQLWVARE